MQASFLKKIIFFTFATLCTLQVAYCQASINLLQKGDSLFKNQQYTDAEKYFRAFYKKTNFLSSPGLLKMAFIEGQKNNFAEQLFFLNSYFEKELDKRILKEMNQIAEFNKLKGYELSDFNFLLLLYKQYSVYLIGGMLLLGIYVFGILFFKRYKNQTSPLRHKIFLTVYIVGLIFIINFPNNYYQQAITNRDNILLRTDASSGASIAETIGKGHRLNVIGKTDIWYRVYWEDRILFLKEHDVWLIK